MEGWGRDSVSDPEGQCVKLNKCWYIDKIVWLTVVWLSLKGAERHRVGTGSQLIRWLERA